MRLTNDSHGRVADNLGFARVDYAKKKLEEAKAAMNDYKAAIFDQVMRT